MKVVLRVACMLAIVAWRANLHPKESRTTADAALCIVLWIKTCHRASTTTYRRGSAASVPNYVEVSQSGIQTCVGHKHYGLSLRGAASLVSRPFSSFRFALNGFEDSLC
jgi:hypothetical protein